MGGAEHVGECDSPARCRPPPFGCCSKAHRGLPFVSYLLSPHDSAPLSQMSPAFLHWIGLCDLGQVSKLLSGGSLTLPIDADDASLPRTTTFHLAGPMAFRPLLAKVPLQSKTGYQLQFTCCCPLPSSGLRSTWDRDYLILSLVYLFGCFSIQRCGHE